jgi:hypothetical protein
MEDIEKQLTNVRIEEETPESRAENRVDEFKQKFANIRDKFENAASHIKDYCNSVRNSLQLQIEYQRQFQAEKLDGLFDGFLKEIDTYESSCIQKFEENTGFRDKMKKFLDEFDKTLASLDADNQLSAQKLLDNLEVSLKLNMDDLTVEEYQNGMIEFMPREVLFDSSSIGFINYKLLNIKLPDLNEMNRISVRNLCENCNKHTRFSVIRMSPINFLLTYVDKRNNLQLIKFDAGGKIHENSLKFKISNFKACKFDTDLYVYVIRMKDSETKLEEKLVYARYLLIRFDLNLQVVNFRELKEPLFCMTASETSVFCLAKEKFSISVYDRKLTIEKRGINFEVEDKVASLPNTSFRVTASSFAKMRTRPVKRRSYLFHQIEVYNSSIFLLTSDQIIVLNETTGKMTNIFDTSAYKFKCLDKDFLLLNMNKSKTLSIYDIKKKEVNKSKIYDKELSLVLDTESKDISLFAKNDFTVYY